MISIPKVNYNRNLRFTIAVILLSASLSAKNAPNIIEVKKGSRYPTIQSGVNAASPGDVVMVREGIYPESVTISTSGKKEAPFTIKAYPGEKVLMDGSEPLTGWTKCSTAEEVSGNPEWKNIWVTTAPEFANRININLIQGDSILTVAQMPEAIDPFYDENTREWFLTSTDSGAYTRGSITDKINLKGMEDDFLKNAFVKIVSGNNEVYVRKITGYAAALNRITFEPLPDGIRMRPGHNRYAISNHPRLIDKPGKYFFDESSRKVYIWPYDASSVNTSITASVRKDAFVFKEINFLTIEGFSIRRYYGTNINGNSSNNIIIKNCNFYEGIIEKDGGAGPTINLYRCNSSVVDGCSLRNNKHNRGIIFNDGSDNTIINCTIRRIGGTGVDFYYQKNSKILYNDLRDCNGQHANGLTCYLPSKNILIEGNIVINCNVGLTYYDVDSMMVVNNIIHGGDKSQATACWNGGRTKNIFFYHNTLIGSGPVHDAIYSQAGNIKNLVVKNNILDGMATKAEAIVSNNLYIAFSGKQHPAGPSDIVALNKENEIFMDYSLRNFLPKPGALSLDAGIDLQVNKDLTRKKRPYGKNPDIGPYEWRGITKK